MGAMSLMLRAVGIAVVSLVALLILRGTGKGFSVFVKVGASLLLFGLALVELSRGITEIRELVSGFIDSSSFVGRSLSVMMRALGVALIGRICADICKDCDENGLAQGVETVSGVIIFSLSLPILSEILQFAADVLSKGS